MRRSTIVIIFFLAIIIAELGVLFYQGRQIKTKAFSLDEQHYVVDERLIEVRPFLFEIAVSDRLQRVAEIMEKEMAESPLQQLLAVEHDLQVNQSEKSLKEGLTEEKSEQNEDAQEKSIVLSENKALIAVVIDDVGLSNPFVKELAKLKKPLTASFLTYGAANVKQAQLLHEAGLEIMLHVPMMPHVPEYLAPVTLSPDMDKEELQAELEKMIARYNGVKLTGVNNHMGSLLTERKQHMGYVMEVLKKHGMFFLDSKTTAHSVVKGVAEQYGVLYIARDVFLDNKNDYEYIMGQFKQTEKIAKKHGKVVAIGHPHSQTLRAMKDWLKDVENRGFRLVHISDLLK